MGERSDIVKRVGYRIRRLRQLEGLTQAELATRSEITRSFLTRIESGLTAPSYESLERIARALDVPIGHIFGDRPLATRPEDAAVAALQAAVIATRGVPVRVVGSIPGALTRLDRNTEAGPVVHVPKDWISGLDLAGLFVLDVGEGVPGVGIPHGSMVLCQPPELNEPRDGDVVVVRMNGTVTLKHWVRSNKIIERDTTGESMRIRLRNGELATVIGFVLYIWTHVAA